MDHVYAYLCNYLECGTVHLQCKKFRRVSDSTKNLQNPPPCEINPLYRSMALIVDIQNTVNQLTAKMSNITSARSLESQDFLETLCYCIQL